MADIKEEKTRFDIYFFGALSLACLYARCYDETKCVSFISLFFHLVRCIQVGIRFVDFEHVETGVEVEIGSRLADF